MKKFDEFINEELRVHNLDDFGSNLGKGKKKKKKKSEEEADKILDKGKKKLSVEDKAELKKIGKKFPKFTTLPLKSDHEIQKFDKVTYNRSDSEHYGKTGVVLNIRKDGKYVVRFDDGSRLAASPEYLIKEKITKAMKIVDPYNEEDW